MQKGTMIKWTITIKSGKKIFLCLLLMGGLCKVPAQSFELQQLILDVQKLTQMKQILTDMKTGYDIVSKGYSTVRDIAQGNFNLHEVFLDGLWLVSPTVRQYWKIPVIIDYQVSIVKEYQSAFSRFQKSSSFNPDEILYMGAVYNKLLDQSLKNIGDLTTVITANQLRMSDAERLHAIDHIYSDMQDKMLFVRSFTNNTSLLDLQRTKEQNDTRMMQQLYGIP
jgi:hypothetical protein